MSTLRAWLRLVAMLLVTVAVLVPAALAGPIGRLWGLTRTGSGLGAKSVITQIWARALLLIMGVRVDAPDRAPPGAWMVVSNHLSYLDVLVIASRIRCRFVAKSEVAGWPFLGIVSKIGGTLFVDRGRGRDLVEVGARIRETLDAGVTVTVFPEGTSTRGLSVERFHAGLLEPAAKGGIDCLPVAIGYELPEGSAAPAWTVCWWGEMTFAPHAWRLMKLRRIDATLRWASVPVRAADRKQLARELHAEVSKLFKPVRQDPEPADNPWSVAAADRGAG